MDGNGWYGDRYKNDGQSVHFFDFNEIKTEIRYRQHKKTQTHTHTEISGVVGGTFNQRAIEHKCNNEQKILCSMKHNLLYQNAF